MAKFSYKSNHLQFELWELQSAFGELGVVETFLEGFIPECHPTGEKFYDSDAVAYLAEELARKREQDGNRLKLARREIERRGVHLTRLIEPPHGKIT